MNGVSFSSSRRTIKQQTFLDRHAKLLEVFARRNKVFNVPIKELESLRGQDYFLAAHAA